MVEIPNMRRAKPVCSSNNLSSATLAHPLSLSATKKKTQVHNDYAPALRYANLLSDQCNITASCRTLAHSFSVGPTIASSPLWQRQLSVLGTAKGLQSSSKPSHAGGTMLHVNLTQILRRATSCGPGAALPARASVSRDAPGDPQKSSPEEGFVSHGQPLDAKH